MSRFRKLSHVIWLCKYHVVIVPKYGKKRLSGNFRCGVGEILRDLSRQRGVELLGGHLMPDHVHMCLRVPPKFSVAFVIGFLKGKSPSLDPAKDSAKQTCNGSAFLGPRILREHIWIG